MADTTRQGVLFPDLFSKSVQAVFTREHLSSNGGTVLLTAQDRQLGLTEAMAGCLVDRREPGKIQHELLTQFRQRVVGIVLGCPDGNDAAKLREDPMMKLACERDPIGGEALASQPTLSRFENSGDAGQLLQMASTLAETVIAEQARRRRGKKLGRIVIVIDPTCDPTYGTQQPTLFNGFYDTYCCLPLIVTISFGGERRKYPVAAVLRGGAASSMVGTLPVLRRRVGSLRRHFGSTRLYLRADSGFAVPELFEFLDAEGLRYAIAMGPNKALKRLAEASMQQARAEAAGNQATCTLYGEASYRSGGWERERRVAYKAQVVVHPDKDEPRDNDR